MATIGTDIVARLQRPKVWKPDGVRGGIAWALSVPHERSALPSNIYRELLAAKFDALIRADPKAARVAMEMSAECSPNFWSIAQDYLVREWAIQIVMCDQLMPHLGALTGTGKVVTLRRTQSFAEILGLF